MRQLLYNCSILDINQRFTCREIKLFFTVTKFQNIMSMIVGTILNSSDFLDHIFPKKVFSIQNKTDKHYHRIQHIQLSLGTNFYVKQ